MNDYLANIFFDCIPKKTSIHAVDDSIITEVIAAKMTGVVNGSIKQGLSENEILGSLSNALNMFESRPFCSVNLVVPAFFRTKQYICEMISGRERAIQIIAKLKGCYAHQKEIYDALALSEKLLRKMI